MASLDGMRHTVAISDIHLCELERTDGLWMRYRQAPYSPDLDLARMLDGVRKKVGGDELCLILNGDVFDFDAPRVIKEESVFHDLPRTAEHAVPMITAILDDHPIFVEALGRVLADGHEIVLISGNHDAQLTLPEVRAVVKERIVAAAKVARPAADVEELGAKVAFRAWFHKTSDGIVVEHGNQYDSYCSFRYPMAPFGKAPAEIQPTMGSLCTRNLVGRMGYFNPHVDGSFMLSSIGYLVHWFRHYLFSRHSLAAAYAVGTVRTLAEIVRRRDPLNRRRKRQNLAAAVEESGAPARAVARHAKLYAPPSEDKLGLVLRELWVDRLALGALSILLGLTWFFTPHAVGGPIAAVGPALFAVYELAIPKTSLGENWLRVQAAARAVAKAHKAKAVILGHTHRPEGRWEDGVFYGNTGSWSPAYLDIECTQPLSDERPVVWLENDGGTLRGGLLTYKNGTFTEAKAPAEASAKAG